MPNLLSGEFTFTQYFLHSRCNDIYHLIIRFRLKISAAVLTLGARIIRMMSNPVFALFSFLRWESLFEHHFLKLYPLFISLICRPHSATSKTSVHATVVATLTALKHRCKRTAPVRTPLVPPLPSPCIAPMHPRSQLRPPAPPPRVVTRLLSLDMMSGTFCREMWVRRAAGAAATPQWLLPTVPRSLPRASPPLLRMFPKRRSSMRDYTKSYMTTAFWSNKHLYIQINREIKWFW